jgi:hypothetical protein
MTIPDAIAREIERQVSAEEVREALRRPVPDTERDEVLALVRWFTRRYQSPEARLAYVRRTYQRWRQTARASGAVRATS